MNGEVPKEKDKVLNLKSTADLVSESEYYLKLGDILRYAFTKR